MSSRDPFAAINCAVAAYAEFVGRNYDEAIRLAREATRQRNDFAGAYRVLTAAAAMGGDIDLARSTLRELRRAQPNISLSWVVRELPLPDEAQRQCFVEAMRRAGLD